MNRLVLVFIFLLLMSACGSGDSFLEELENAGVVDSIRVNPYTPIDSAGKQSSDTIRISNDSISNDKDSTKVNDSLSVTSHSEIEFTRLFTIKSRSTKSTQGLAIYGDELFNFHDTNDVIDVYNMKTCKAIASIKLEPGPNVHCNTISFSNKFYSNEDKYPLIYAQQAGEQNKVNVYRIICKDSILKAEMVQMISFTPCTHSLTAIDKEKEQLCIIYSNKGRYISLTSIPNFTGGDTTIDLRRTEKTYTIHIPKVVQDTAFDNNCLYFICGYRNEGELWKINLQTKTAQIIDLTKYGLTAEPEGLDVYNGSIIVSFFNNTVYSLRLVH